MDPAIEREVNQLASEAVKISEEIDSVAEAGAALEDIEGAKALAADFLMRYDNLAKKIQPPDLPEIQRRIGSGIEEIKKKLTHLKEAPE
jgi:cell fate (sporulation/competence/biofilm development) regulator YlbF (YheA/YmcA/DUF963 family)